MERLTAADLSMVWPEDFGWPQDIGALAILDGSTLLDANGRLQDEIVRDHIRQRLHLLPRLRQLLHVPRKGLGWPLWVDSPSLDLGHHVEVFRLGSEADETRLLEACEELFMHPLDRSRPLWHVWVLPGLPEGRIGLLMKVHHAIADGVAGVASFGALLDFVPDALSPTVPPWSPSPPPASRDLFQDNVLRRIDGLTRSVARLAHPNEALRGLRRDWPAVREAFAEGRAPKTSLNRQIGSGRRLASVRSRLDVAKEVAHALGGKVNDVLLAAVAGGLRDLLRGRGERVDGLVLRAFVPVSLHREAPGQARGNLDGGMIVPLPVGEPDHVRRLRLIAAETARRKKRSRPGPRSSGTE